ncbi:nodulin MtN21/EamA-like transporter family protein [Senna tora]|uniref:Nodulin MtN21/EamA-like transporter family protein n=1 Tax=Senna tora TaxID=362788 RepID=A0A834SU41_9FABA|nr:nodulin MtN21/EamA-like transporter family protein [Senna tora]
MVDSGRSGNCSGRRRRRTETAGEAPMAADSTCSRSTLNTWASGVSLQLMRVLAMAVVSKAKSELGPGTTALVGKSWKGSHRSREKGSKTLVLRPAPKKLGINDIIMIVELLWMSDENGREGSGELRNAQLKLKVKAGDASRVPNCSKIG